MKEKVVAAVKMLREQGHSVHAQVRDGKQWFHVDERMLVSWAEMNDMAEGVFSLVELEDYTRDDGLTNNKKSCDMVRAANRPGEGREANTRQGL